MEREERAKELISRVATPEPDDAFKAELRERLVTQAAARRKANTALERRWVAPRPAYPLLRRAVLVSGLVLVLFMSFTGGAYALSAGKNPDSNLYGTKLFFEEARLSITGSHDSKAELELTYSRERLREMRYLAEAGVSRGSERCLNEYEELLTRAREHIYLLEGGEFDRLSAEFLRLTQEQLEELTSLQDGGGSVADMIEAAAGACDGARQSMGEQMMLRRGQGGEPMMQPGGDSDGTGSGSGADGGYQGGPMQDGGPMMQQGGGGGPMMP
ncbi:MAG: DUF5667 domain-containing protein [Candidatus Geothermincolia bacterium]